MLSGAQQFERTATILNSCIVSSVVIGSSFSMMV